MYKLQINTSLPVGLVAGVHCEASHFMSVFGQLFVAGHAVSVDNVDYRVLRTNPHLLLDQSYHTVLHRGYDKMYFIHHKAAKFLFFTTVKQNKQITNSLNKKMSM